LSIGRLADERIAPSRAKRRKGMNVLVQGSLEFLEAVYSEELALFPFSTALRGDAYVNDYSHKRALRCTVNCLLGLTEAARHDPASAFAKGVDALVERFLRRHEVDDPGDLGLLTVTLSDERYPQKAFEEVLAQVRAVAGESSRLRALDVQDLCWLLWGAVAADRRGGAGAEALAHRLFDLLRNEYVEGDAALPRHHLGRGRRRFVSFGACVYYAHVTQLYGLHFGDSGAVDLFRRAAEVLLAGQGPFGEWPWLVHCADGRPLDFYPVFSVHQTSMSMLVLHPARNEQLAGVDEAVARSLAWVGGHNQLGRPMLQRHPFFIYRSMERLARWPRAERYVRATARSFLGSPAQLADNEKIRLNTESRSYELGWVLYMLPQMGPLPEPEVS
jgi:hypothetical protein